MPIGDGQVMGRIRSFLTEPTFANVSGMTPEDVDRRRALAQALWSEGNNSEPVTSIFGGMNKMLQSFLGGRQLWKAENTDIAVRERDRTAAEAEAARVEQQRVAGLNTMIDFGWPGQTGGTATAAGAAPPAIFDGRPTRENAERQDAIPSTLARYGSGLNTQGIDPVFAQGIDGAIQAYIAAGGNPADVQINSLVRSTEEQARLYEQYQRGEIGLAAPPGQSRHEYGAAADIQSGPFLDWAHQNAGQFGLSFLQGNAFTNDPGHVQLAGPSPAGTRPTATSATPADAPDPTRQFLRELAANPQMQPYIVPIIQDQITRLTTPPAPVDPVTVAQGTDLVTPTGELLYTNPPEATPGYRDLIDPAERAARGIAADDTRTVQVGPDNQLHFTTANGSSVTPGALRTEIRQLQSYKNYYESLPIYQSMLSAAGTDDKAADLNLVYGLAKIFDPTSVVREGEQVLVRNAAGLPDQLVGWIDGLNGGGALEPSVRAAIMAQAYSRVTAYQNDLRGQLDFYGGVAQRNNIPTEDLYAPLGELRQWSPGAAGAATVPGATPPPAAAGPAAQPTIAPGTVMDGYRFNGGDPADQRNWTPVQ